MVILMKKKKVKCFQRATCQIYSRLLWRRNLEIYSKSKNVNVKIVSKSHTYVSLCCIASTYSLQFEFFHEPALPQGCESRDGLWFLMHDQAISAIYISIVCWVPNMPLKFCFQSCVVAVKPTALSRTLHNFHIVCNESLNCSLEDES